MVISLNELNNSNNLEDGRPSNTLFTYYVTGPECSTRFEPVTPQYKTLKNGMITSLTLKITDENNNIVNDGPGTTVVLHIKCGAPGPLRKAGSLWDLCGPIIYSHNLKWNAEND